MLGLLVRGGERWGAGLTSGGEAGCDNEVSEGDKGEDGDEDQEVDLRG